MLKRDGDTKQDRERESVRERWLVITLVLPKPAFQLHNNKAKLLGKKVIATETLWQRY